MNIINGFKNGAWIDKAKQTIGNPEKIKDLLKQVFSLINKKGLSSVREQIELICSYVKDIMSGKYKDYDMFKLIVLIAALIYVVSPIDLIPDVIPVIGWTDDVAVILWAAREMNSELLKYKEWQKQGGV